MKKIILYFLASLGSIFLMILISLVYFYITDPLNLKPIIFNYIDSASKINTDVEIPKTEEVKNTDEVDSTEVVEDTENQPEVTDSQMTETSSNFILSQSQKDALINLGVPPESIPNTITPAQEQCFVGILGESRVEEIKAGAVPGMLEFIKAQACI